MSLFLPDLFHQHLAYENGGLAAINQLHPQYISNDQKTGWEQVDQGLQPQGDPQSVYDGNEQLLRVEQQVTLQQGIYDKYPQLWANLSSWPYYLTLTSPQPNHDTVFTNFVKPMLPPETQPLLGNFNHRWLWIVDDAAKPEDEKNGQMQAFARWSEVNANIDIPRLLAGENL